MSSDEEPSRPVKHSLTLRGHRTSVSLEAAFWSAFRGIATREGLTLNELAARIDNDRRGNGLASAIRVYILQDLQRLASQTGGWAAGSSGSGVE
ncbi:MAG: ribbon-helix-helix domain-containing protein [Roseinatronobacter sp.]